MTHPTFEQYADSLQGMFGPHVDMRTEPRTRDMYEREMFARSVWPVHVPACPAWCIDPAGHQYEGWEMDKCGTPVFSRLHHAYLGQYVTVDGIERYRNGGVPDVHHISAHLEQMDLLTAAEVDELALEVDAAARMLALIEVNR